MSIRLCVCLTLLVCAVVSCSQEGNVEVKNLSGGSIDGTVDGRQFQLYDGQSSTVSIDIGTKFIFGTDEKDVEVSYTGDCVWDRKVKVNVSNDETAVVKVVGETGYLVVINGLSGILNVFLSDCSSQYWPDQPTFSVLPYETKTAKLAATCWDILFVFGENSQYDRFWIDPCDILTYDTDYYTRVTVTTGRCGDDIPGFDASLAVPLVLETSGAGLGEKKTDTRHNAIRP